MTNSEKRRQYFQRYWKEHKEECKERNRRNYQRRKELGLQVGEIDIYHSVEELKEAEGMGEGKINWEAWDKVVEQTKQQITNALENYKQPSNRKSIYVYTINSKIPIITFKDSDEAATTLNLTRMQVTNHARSHVPIYYKNIILSYTPINEKED